MSSSVRALIHGLLDRAVLSARQPAEAFENASRTRAYCKCSPSLHAFDVVWFSKLSTNDAANRFAACGSRRLFTSRFLLGRSCETIGSSARISVMRTNDEKRVVRMGLCRLKASWPTSQPAQVHSQSANAMLL